MLDPHQFCKEIFAGASSFSRELARIEGHIARILPRDGSLVHSVALLLKHKQRYIEARAGGTELELESHEIMASQRGCDC